MNNLSINVFSGFSYEELLPLAHSAGFNAFFSDHEEALSLEKMREIKKIATENNLEYETSHSTIPGCTNLWIDSPKGNDYVDVLIRNIDNCAQLSIRTLVVHVQLDFGAESDFNFGIKRLQQVVNYAQSKNVIIAFENINSSNYLYQTLEYFDSPNVGFCYDCGHEKCYTPRAEITMIYKYEESKPVWINFENPKGAKGCGGLENLGAKGHAFEHFKAGEKKSPL